MTEKIKVLMVEDARDTTKISKTVLSEKGYSVEGCRKDGKEVIKAVKEIEPDVVIIEMYMTGYDAPEVCSAIRNESLIKKPAIIVMTNYDNGFMEREVTEAGADLIMLKPFDYDVLCHRIERLCRTRLEVVKRG